MVALLLSACATGPADDASGTDPGTTPTGDDSAATCVLDPTPPDDPLPGWADRPAEVWNGRVTWTVDFGLLAEHDGFHDCTYTRAYTDLVEITDQPWLCDTCTVVVKGAATVVEGYDDCYAQISSADAERVEQVGLSEQDGATWFLRGGNENVRLVPLAPVVTSSETHIEVAWSDPAFLDGTRWLTLSAAGGFDRAMSGTETVSDPQDPREEPYACGWPLANPGGPNPTWELTDGGVFPNFRLEDQCGDPVSFWDFRGRYVVVDASSPDCGPCQAMATAAPAFEASMREACVDVRTVTLLNDALSSVNLPAERRVRRDWAETFGLDAPVLGDLGLGYAVLPPYLGQRGGMSLPSWVVVAPDGRIVGGGSGYSDDAGGFDEIRAMILDDVASTPGG